MPPEPQNSEFRSLDLPEHLQSRLDRLGFTIPTPIQRESIPVALSGRDLIGIAQTGTGKTLAFGLPMLSRLSEGQQGLVIAPTRELAMQINETLRNLGARTVLLIGGASMHMQVQAIKKGATVFVATPGRLKDHLYQRTINLGRVSIAVLDEADRMLDMGFAPDIRRIFDAIPAQRQTLLYSATMPKEIEDLARTYLQDAVRVEIAAPGTTAERVTQEVIVVQKDDKHTMLAELLKDYKGTTLVFARTRHGARKLAKVVRTLGHTAAELHSDRTLAQRKAALEGFKSGDFRVLVATDIAARGIDVKEISLVVNFDLPSNAEDYVHRIGRTGRAGAEGVALTLATPEQASELYDIEKQIRAILPRSSRSQGEIPIRALPVAQPAGKKAPSAPSRGASRNTVNARPRESFRRSADLRHNRK